jgi:multiple sugar transport system substrate-binding protein
MAAASIGSVATAQDEARNITFWSTETQPERLQITQGIVERFQEETGIGVTLVPVDENNLTEIMTSAAATGILPEVVFHPIDFTVGWASQGLLDTEAANAVVESLGPDTFSQAARDLATIDGAVAAVPSDGWGQLLVYRKDLFDAAGLEAPTTYETIQAAAAALNDPENDFYGITAANVPGEVFTQQTFEYFALANGCELTDDAGVAFGSPECVEAMQFFTDLLNDYSVGGAQDVVSTRAAYFAGQAGMIAWSPFILDEMAGLRDAAFPACDECADNPAYLAENSGIVTAIAGPSGEPSQYGQISYMGIGANSDTEAAQQFLEYWFSDPAYIEWLSTSVEGKFPMRSGTTEDPTAFIDQWKTLATGVDRKAPLSDFYSQEIIDSIAAGADNFARWGFPQGQGELVTAVYTSLPVPAAIGEVLDGSMSVEEAVAEATAVIEEELSLIGG